MNLFGHQKGSIENLSKALKNSNVSLRWGGPQVDGAINGKVHLLNGLEQLQILKAAKIPVPPFFTDQIQALAAIGHGELILGRKLHHTQGKDITLYTKAPNKWLKSDFWVQYIPTIREWRFHILKGRSIARGLKAWVGPQAKVSENSPIIRSRRLGWHLRHDINPPEAARTLACKAVKAVGYDLGAVDLLELEGGKFLVLEVNSRPAIRDPYTISRYTSALAEL